MSCNYFLLYSFKWKVSYTTSCMCHADYFFCILVQGAPQFLGTFHTSCSLTHPCLGKCMHILSSDHSQAQVLPTCRFSLRIPVTQISRFSHFYCTHSTIEQSLIFTLIFAHGLVTAPRLHFRLYEERGHVISFCPHRQSIQQTLRQFF